MKFLDLLLFNPFVLKSQSEQITYRKIRPFRTVMVRQGQILRPLTNCVFHTSDGERIFHYCKPDNEVEQVGEREYWSLALTPTSGLEQPIEIPPEPQRK